jgi:uncharacterized protein (TIGR02118 family)
MVSEGLRAFAHAAPAQGARNANQRTVEEMMIKVSVLYPYQNGARFDMGYYLDKHIPMVCQKLGAACKGVLVESGLGGGAPGAPPTYVAMAHLSFDSVDAFQASFGPHAATIMADIPNYYPGQPVVQVSEVKL